MVLQFGQGCWGGRWWEGRRCGSGGGFRGGSGLGGGGRTTFQPRQPLPGAGVGRVEFQHLMKAKALSCGVVNHGRKPEPGVFVALINFHRLDKQLVGLDTLTSAGSGYTLPQKIFSIHLLLL